MTSPKTIQGGEEMTRRCKDQQIFTLLKQISSSSHRLIPSLHTESLTIAKRCKWIPQTDEKRSKIRWYRWCCERQRHDLPITIAVTLSVPATWLIMLHFNCKQPMHDSYPTKHNHRQLTATTLPKVVLFYPIALKCRSCEVISAKRKYTQRAHRLIMWMIFKTCHRFYSAVN